VKEIVLATGNKGKVMEIKEALSGLSVTLLTLEDFPDLVLPPEDGSSFEENALIKARYAAKETGLPALADDSGLVVEALSGAPGIHSARYAGEDATDGENIDKLLGELEAVSDDRRQASFICALALVFPELDREELFMGEVAGSVMRERKGANGFGYDPVFFIPALNRSAAELTNREKLSVSHRGQAIKKFREWLSGELSEGN
jgi:XTP/dITP diphosphohydrolase